MGQIVFNGQKPKYCNLVAITTGNHATDVPKAGEIWLIDSTNTPKSDGIGKYDYYIVGNNRDTASQLAVNKIRIDDNDIITIDAAPTEGSNNAVSSGGVYQAIQDSGSGITDVDVTVDNTSGTPSGSASVSGSTLTLNFSGLKGATGAAGAKGDTGATGPAGQKGDKGDKGDTGDTGPRGLQGIQGVQGPAGPSGTNGVTGEATIVIVSDIDTTTTYDSTKDVASAEAVQNLVKMLGTVYYTQTT